LNKMPIAEELAKKQKFVLYAEIPDRKFVQAIEPEPLEVRDRIIKWEVEVEPAEKKEYVFRMDGKEVDFDENNLYVLGIDPVNVVGAEKWEGEK